VREGVRRRRRRRRRRRQEVIWKRYSDIKYNSCPPIPVLLLLLLLLLLSGQARPSL